MLHFLCFVSNKNLKGFTWKQYDKACKATLTVPRISIPMTSTVHVPMTIIGTLRSEDGDGGENVAEKVNSRSFNLHHD